MTNQIYVISGPNLNLLGTREPEIYGTTTLAEIHEKLSGIATARGFELVCYQSNNEGDIVTKIQEAGKGAKGLIINAAAFTHTSIAIADAIKAINTPVVEVHLSNIFQRETFRHHSYISPLAIGVICGFGPKSYEMALDVLTITSDK